MHNNIFPAIFPLHRLSRHGAALLAAFLPFLAIPAHSATILEAAATRRAQVELTSLGATSGDALVLEVTNQSNAQAVWSVPPGLVAEAENGRSAKMIVRRLKGRRIDAQRYQPQDAVRLASGESAQYVLEAYSLELVSNAPVRGAPYRLVSRREDLGRIFDLAHARDASNRVVQAALWIAASEQPREELRPSIPVSDEEFEQATDLALAALKGGADSSMAPRTPRPPAFMGAAPDEPPLHLESRGLRMGQQGERRSATVRLYYRWTIPPEQRPRVYIVALRFEGLSMTSAVIPARMEFDGVEGIYESVVAQGALKGAGQLVYAVLEDMTVATDPRTLNRAFDMMGGGLVDNRISNVLRVPVNWSEESDLPLDVLLTGEFSDQAAATHPATAATRPAASPTPTPPAPMPTPERMDRALRTPVAIDLPLANGGLLRGTLLGARDGKLVLRAQVREFEFDPIHLGGSGEEILSQARADLQAGRNAEALQRAAIAGLLVEDPTEAARILLAAGGQ